MDMNARLSNVLEKIRVASNKIALERRLPRLVAVSKTRPAEDVIEAYKCGQRHFGENYIAELVTKSNDPKLLPDCPEIRWHFIGALQSNKVNMLVKVPRLYMIETVHSEGIAKKLNDAWLKHQQQPSDNNIRLKVLIQVKTSEDEETKSGCSPEEVPTIADSIRKNCPHLELCGLMTIGSQQHSAASLDSNFNPDFQALISCKEKLCEHFGGDEFSRSLELSMGMSSDFEVAIAMGSTNVRVGSLIFGPR